MRYRGGSGSGVPRHFPSRWSDAASTTSHSAASQGQAEVRRVHGCRLNDQGASRIRNQPNAQNSRRSADRLRRGSWSRMAAERSCAMALRISSTLSATDGMTTRSSTEPVEDRHPDDRSVARQLPYRRRIRKRALHAGGAVACAGDCLADCRADRLDQEEAAALLIPVDLRSDGQVCAHADAARNVTSPAHVVRCVHVAELERWPRR